MTEPTSAFSFRKIITRIAKEARIAYYGTAGDKPAMPPIDKQDLSDLKEVVNDGIKQFIADAPKTGWRWMRRIMSVTLTGTRITGTADAADATSITDATLETTYDSDDDLNDMWVYILTGTGAGSYAQIDDYTASGGVVNVLDWLDQYGNAGGTDPAADSTFAITGVETVAGDIARYPLPEYFGGEVDGEIHYEKDSGTINAIDWVNESYIRTKRATSVQSGYPRHAAIRHLEPLSSAAGPKRRFELFLDPEPNSAYVLEFPFIMFFDKLDMEMGVGDFASTITIVDATRDEYDDYFNGWRIEIISGTGKGSYAIITDYASGTFTVADWLKPDGSAEGTDPDTDSVYLVEPLNNLHPAGFRFDRVIESSCLSEAEIKYEDVGGAYVNRYHSKDLPKAYEMDGRSAPRKLGSMNRYKLLNYRTYNDCTFEGEDVS